MGAVAAVAMKILIRSMHEKYYNCYPRAVGYIAGALLA